MRKLIIFDVDGTLLDTERIYMRAWVQAGREAGFTVTDEALKQTRAVNATVAKQVFCRHCGADFPYEAVRDRRIEIAEELIAATPAEQLHMPYTLTTLWWLKKEGYPLAAASSTGYDKTCAHLQHAGLLDDFQVIVGGDMVQKGKPEPDIFWKAARLAGYKEKDCVVVGDTPADVLAGHSAGMDVVLIPDQVPANEQTTRLSRCVLPSLAHLPRFLESEYQ